MAEKISVSWIKVLSNYLPNHKMFLAKERLCSRILSDVKFAVFLWHGINKINADLPLVMTSGTVNIHGNREISYYVAQTVVEVANTESDTKNRLNP